MSSLDSSNVPPNTEIAYKDVARQALSERDGVSWLMSMGDQSTDSYGQHSGARILIPNLLFNKAILFNNPRHGPTNGLPWNMKNNHPNDND